MPPLDDPSRGGHVFSEEVQMTVNNNDPYNDSDDFDPDFPPGDDDLELATDIDAADPAPGSLATHRGTA